MKKNDCVKSDTGGISRRTFNKGVLSSAGLGLAYGTGIAPAFGQGNRELICGMWGGDVGNLSPTIRSDVKAGILIYNLFDGLVRPNYAKGTIEPWVAEAWSNPDPLTWRIKIREGVMWQGNYGEVTASDLAYTWQVHLDTKSWQVKTSFSQVDSFKVVSKYVLEVKLTQPLGAFPGIAMGYGGQIVPENAHREMGNDNFSLAPVGNGPYMLESVLGSEVILKKNPNYWRSGLPHMERIVYRSFPDASVRLQSLLKGEVDFLTHPDAKDVAEASQNTDFVTHRTAGWTWDYQHFNLSANEGMAYHNKLIRQAISYAIDRQAIVDEIYHGQATVTDNAIPPGFLGHRKSMLKYPKNGDLEKARELIAKAGLQGYEVEVITSDKDWLRKELELVAAMVSQVGINYKIRNLDIGSFNNLWIKNLPKFQQSLEDITIVAPDPHATVYWFLHSEGSVSSGYNNPKMDTALDKAMATTDPAGRAKLYHEVVDMTLDDCSMIYHLNANYTRMHNKKLEGFNPSPQEYIEMMDTIRWKA